MYQSKHELTQSNFVMGNVKEHVMAEKNSKYEEFYQRASEWLDDVNNHEVKSMVKLIDTAKAYLSAAEDLTEEEVSMFLSGLKRDLNEFYLRYQGESKNSVWLASINDRFWHGLAQMTDKSQVEWTELTADFEHNGIYCRGDMVGFGIFRCNHCQHAVEVLHPSKLCECPKCSHHQFTRYSLAP